MIVTANLSFSEWTQVIPNARLCKALLDRITDRAHIIETGPPNSRKTQGPDFDNDRDRTAAGGGEKRRLKGKLGTAR